MNKKLIEVAIPLEAINKESSREKSIRHGHPSTLHLWWARRPLATTRAVLFASLVDDPSSHPDLFPTEEEENKERERLFQIIEELITWENSNDPTILEKARREISKYVSDPIEFLDPFAGGGAIPLEAKRLGLNTHAYDLNPVAVTINRAMIDLPSRFRNNGPVNPEFKFKKIPSWYTGSEGLAEDVRYYGNVLKDVVWNRVKQYYPSYENNKGTEDTVIAWLWSRTVTCPNPLCRCIVPMIKSTTLSTTQKKYVDFETSENDIKFIITEEKPDIESTVVNKRGGICPKCHTTINLEYLYDEYKKGRVNPKMMAVVCDGNPGRKYYAPYPKQTKASDVSRPEDLPDVKIEGSNRDVHVRHYGIDCFTDLFTNRQLMILKELCDALKEVKDRIIKDALANGTWGGGFTPK